MYRLLENGETILKSDDTYCHAGDYGWVAVSTSVIGEAYNDKRDLPVRRRVSSPVGSPATSGNNAYATAFELAGKYSQYCGYTGVPSFSGFVSWCKKRLNSQASCA